MQELFRKFARVTAEIVGSPWAFVTGVLLVVLWVVSGPIFHFSDTWQLAINTLTTVVTFLMVFVIQNSQNRDAKALHLKLDELLRAIEPARTGLVDLENRPDAELAELQSEFKQISQEQLEAIEEKIEDIGQDVQEHLEGHGKETREAVDIHAHSRHENDSRQ
jgi:low affinity Fe/Cu permease